jgi:hypothetical protein
VLRSQVGRLVAGDVPLDEAPAMWQAFDGLERLATAAKTLLAERVEESRVWTRAGDRSAAEYLARTSGSSVGVARSGLETAKRLRRLPATEAAVRRGALSRAQTEAIADAAAVNPAAEGSLLATAERSSLVELRQHANRAKAAGDPDPDATHRRIHRQRCLRRFTDGRAPGTCRSGAPPTPGRRSTPRSTRSSTRSSGLPGAASAASPETDGRAARPVPAIPASPRATTVATSCAR